MIDNEVCRVFRMAGLFIVCDGLIFVTDEARGRLLRLFFVLSASSSDDSVIDRFDDTV